MIYRNKCSCFRELKWCSLLDFPWYLWLHRNLYLMEYKFHRTSKLNSCKQAMEVHFRQLFHAYVFNVMWTAYMDTKCISYIWKVMLASGHKITKLALYILVDHWASFTRMQDIHIFHFHIIIICYLCMSVFMSWFRHGQVRQSDVTFRRFHCLASDVHETGSR